MSYKEPKSAEEYNKIFAETSVALVYLTATWCGPCRAIAPVFEKFARENPEITFIKVDVDACSSLDICKSVSGVPTFIAYRGKVEVDRKTGASPANVQALVQLLK